jgi:ribosomal protein S4
MIRKKKGARIKKVLNKTILPFYGHLSEKQFASIKKKVQRKKTESLSRDDLLLGHFERRLDVVVYRLNLAPNIF